MTDLFTTEEKFCILVGIYENEKKTKDPKSRQKR